MDIGGSMTIHTFGAFFGVAACIFYPSDPVAKKDKCAGSYLTNLVAFVGTLFLFCYWPSFNGALGYGSAMLRA